MPITLVCAYCGTEFEAYPSAVRRGRRYCSKSCAEKAKWLDPQYRQQMSKAHIGFHHTEKTKGKISEALKQQWEEGRRIKHPRIEYMCDNCGKKFSVIRSRHKRGKVRFCSKDCRYDYIQGKTFPGRRDGEYKVCPVCGEEFYVYPSEADERIYCSKDCFLKVQGEYSKKFWMNPEYAKQVIGKLHTRPSKPEKQVIEIIRERRFPLKYVGDGKITIGTLNPDFIHNNGKKKILEVFGRAFHDPKESFKEEIPWHQQYFGRMSYYAQHGYDCLILWDDELRNEEVVAQKIERFIND